MAGARRLENEIRVGLEQTLREEIVRPKPQQEVDTLDQLSFGKPIRRHVRDFGLLFAIIGGFVGGWQAFKGKPSSVYLVWLTAAAVLAVLGLFAPRVLLPVWRAWMKFAHYLSIVMTAVLLTLTWCFGFLLIAFILKILGIRRIDLAYGDGRSSYWEKRDPKYDDFKRLELQY